MTKMNEIEHWEEYWFPCDGQDGGYVKIAWDEDPDFRWIEVEEGYVIRSLKDRLNAAWKTLRGRRVDTDIVVLNEKSMQGLIDLFKSKVDDD